MRQTPASSTQGHRLVAMTLGLAVGCAQDDASPSPRNTPRVSAGAYVTANIDDDNGNGVFDFEDPYFTADNDIATWTLPSAPQGETMSLRFSGALDQLKLWRGGKDWMGQGDGIVVDEFTFLSDGEPVDLQIEMGQPNARVRLEVESSTYGTERYELRASPVIFNHHLQGYEKLWIVESEKSRPTVSGFMQVLGPDLQVLQASDYLHDIWLQDEVEFASMTGMNGARINVVVNSIRNRGLHAFPERELTTPTGAAKDWVQGSWGLGEASSGDSMGNVEVSPPVRVDGVHYPFGRIYHGNRGHGRLNAGTAAFLRSQQIQKPFGLDTSWLCVGHVDEILTFVPLASAPRGFLMLINDTLAGFELLETLPEDTPLARYAQYERVGQLRNDPKLREFNARVQRDGLDPTLARMKRELALSDEEIIKVPAIYHARDNCRGPANAGTLIPNLVNMVVLPSAHGGPTKLLAPDPFFRATDALQDEDALIPLFRGLLSPRFEVHFIDDWDAYHSENGNLHCASQVLRTPAGPWWPSSSTKK